MDLSFYTVINLEINCHIAIRKLRNFIHIEYLHIHYFRFSTRYYRGWEGGSFFFWSLICMVVRWWVIVFEEIFYWQHKSKEEMSGLFYNIYFESSSVCFNRSLKHVYICLTSKEIRGIFSGRRAVNVKKNVHVFSHHHHNESISKNLL